MTKRGVKQERVSRESMEEVEEVEEVVMPSTRHKRKTRSEVVQGDVEMTEATSVSTNSFPAMPTPASYEDEHLPTNVQERPSIAGIPFHRSAAPSAETGLHLVGHRVQVLVDAIQDFREFGVDHVVQLPELVLVGDQSAGKSSLMGALAEIHLPQSAGCCTRCPAHIKTTQADTWSCKISLEQEYTYEPGHGRPIESRDVTRNRPFPPWKEQDLEVKPFVTITHKKQLEEALKWAQIATLNPDKHHSQYVPGTGTCSDESTTAKFSPNVVSIEIAGPGLVPLSFYDLPGIFQNAGQKENQYLVKVIENLAGKYIRRPQALIICALPMSADPATSRTAKVIADLNAATRCIGVLTKADQLQDGQSHTDFENMLRGRDFQLGHGYYVTKLPGQSREDIIYDEDYHANARAAEELFFFTQSPWDSEWSEFRSRFGTSNLAQALSQKFAAQIIESIPDIESKVERRAFEIESQLLELPELPTERILHIVLQHLAKFSIDVQNLLDGGSSHNEFQSEWAKLCERFRETILGMKPMIVITDRSDSVLPEPDVINIDEDDDSTVFDSPVSGNKRTSEETPTPTGKKPKFDQSGSGSFSNSFGIPFSPRKPAAEDELDVFAQYIKAGKKFATIADIRQSITKHSKTGVPGIVNDQVYSEMCKQSVTPWEDPLEKLVEITLQMLRNYADQILHAVLSKWQQTELFKQCRQHLSTFFDDFEEQQRMDSNMLLELETYKLFTVNTLALEEYRQEEGRNLRRGRKAARAKAYIEREVAMRRRPPFKDESAKRRAIADVKDEQLGKDPFETEIEVAAYVRGYYKTASLRFVDSVCLSINGKLFRNAKAAIFYFLERKLCLDKGDGEQRCRELLEENAFVAARRAKLKKEKGSLSKFTNRLHQLAEDNAALDVVDAQGGVA